MPKSKHRKNKKAYTPPKSNEELEGSNSFEQRKDGSFASSIEENLLENDFNIDEIQGRGEKFINDNKGLVLGSLGALFLILAAYFFLTRVQFPGQEAAAQDDLFQAQTYFERDSFALALNGDGNFPGFLEIIDTYSGRTKAANLSKYYAGISYLNLGEYQNAIDYLGKFKSSDMLVSGMAKGAMGDAYMELGDETQGISYYKQAASTNPNELVSPLFYMKAGNALEKSGNFSEAKTMYSKLLDWPKSQYSQDAQKYISRVEAQM